MPLFDLFKKPPKKEPVRDDAFGSPEMQKKRYEAAMDFLKVFQQRMPLVGGKPHAGTVLSVAARLAGTSLFRSLNKEDVTPGMIVLSEEVNQAYPQLLNLFAFYCKQNGMDVMSKPMVTKFPRQDEPLMKTDQVLAEYQDQYHAVMKKHGLGYLDGARAGMIVCSIIFQYHQTVAKDIDPDVAAGIVAMSVVEGAKTAPLPLKPQGASPAPADNPGQRDQVTELLKRIAANSTDGSGPRLVIGEGMTPMQEALANGGVYTLVHPEVLKQLKQNNIDPFLVYEAALRIEIESRIPRIDLAGAAVDEVLKAWTGKPSNQVPLHARQVLWLEENANRLAYERKGNSWILKQ